MTNILTRDTIEKILNGEHTSNKISIRSALETALALFDKLDLANEEIRHAYSDNETHRQRINELESENAGLSKAYAEANKLLLEKEAENERLKKEAELLEWLDGPTLEKWARKCAKYEAENARLREQLRLTQIDWNNEASENAALREVVEASKKLSAHLDIVHGSFYSPNGLSPSKMLNDILKAALARLEGK